MDLIVALVVLLLVIVIVFPSTFKKFPRKKSTTPSKSSSTPNNIGEKLFFGVGIIGLLGVLFVITFGNSVGVSLNFPLNVIILFILLGIFSGIWIFGQTFKKTGRFFTLCLSVALITIWWSQSGGEVPNLSHKSKIPNAEYKTPTELAIDKSQERRKVDGEWVYPQPIRMEQIPDDMDRSPPSSEWEILDNFLLESKTVTVPEYGLLGVRCYEFEHGPPEDPKRFFKYIEVSIRTKDTLYNIECGYEGDDGVTETVYVTDDSGNAVRLNKGDKVQIVRLQPKGGPDRIYSAPNGKFASVFKPPQLLLRTYDQ